jgi:trehalose/maltose hydrolase-like predicted phosphorylase
MKKAGLTILIACHVVLMKAQDPWVIQADRIDPANYYGVTVSNGVIGLVSSPEPLKMKEVILAGIYDNYGRGRTGNFLPGFNLLDVNMSVGGKDVRLSGITGFRQELDMRTGMFTGAFELNGLASVEYTYCALRHLPYNVLMTVKVTPKADTYLVVENTLRTSAALRDDQHYYNEVNPPHAYIPLLTSVAKSPSGRITVVASQSFLFREEHGSQPQVLHEMRDSDAHLMKFAKPLRKGETYSFSIIGTLISSVQAGDPYNQAERLTIYAALQGTDNLIERHRQEWSKLWESDIRIEGDPQAQQDIHNMMYHLYSFTREGSGYSLSPMGLSGLGYNGHVFWDTEMFMFMPLLLLHPDLAKGLTEYRFERLDAARRNALAYGYKGAMYPWESAGTGEEECPVWALTGPYEHHITGDVAFAAWHYYLLTQDKAWLKAKGWPVLKHTAEFWESRVTLKDGKYHILNVVCADEWAENVDNNAYTNAIARLNLQYANRCAKVLGEAENDRWTEIAANLVFGRMENGVTREHDRYNGQPIKQADVNLMAYPLMVITDEEQIRRDLDYYATKVPEKDTPAMTQAIFALLYSRLGDGEKAWHYFKDAYEPNLLPPFRVPAETKGGTNPYFITGAGGVLQAVMMGFGGIHIQADGSIRRLNTARPAHWKKLEIILKH